MNAELNLLRTLNYALGSYIGRYDNLETRETLLKCLQVIRNRKRELENEKDSV